MTRVVRTTAWDIHTGHIEPLYDDATGGNRAIVILPAETWTEAVRLLRLVVDCRIDDGIRAFLATHEEK